jgi:type II secretion system protein D
MIVVASLVAACGLARSVWARAQEGEPAAAPMVGQEAVATADPAAGSGEAGAAPAAEGGAGGAASEPAVAAPVVPDAGIGFNFKDAPIDRVLDLFARQAGRPIIFEAPAPQGTLTFVSAERYTFAEALSILNLNLQRFGVSLREEDRYLYLATIQDAMRRPVQVATPEELAKFTPDTIVTVGITLDNARVEQVVEQVKAMIGPFGGVLAVPTQNMVIVVESAAQVARIRQVIESIDAIRPVDSAFRIFPIVHAQADAVLNALSGLLGERQRTVIVDKDGKSRVVEEVAVTGINMTADPRTNSIVCVGAEARIDTARELIQLLDVPASGSAQRELATLALSVATADEAAQRLNALFGSAPEGQRPTIIPLPRAAKVSILGSPEHVAQARVLVRELEGGVSADSPRTTAFVEMSNTAGPAAEAVVSRVLQGALSPASRVIAGPDGRSLLVSGTPDEVAQVRAVVAAIDGGPARDRDLRVLRLGAEARDILDRARALHERADPVNHGGVDVSLDASTGVATLVGSRGALASFDRALEAARVAASPEVVARRYVLTRVAPSVVADRARRLIESVSPAQQGEAGVEFDALDDLMTLVVRAVPARHSVIAELVATLDAQDASDRVVRVLTPRGESAESLRDRVSAAMGQGGGQDAGQAGGDAAGMPTVTVDAASGALVLAGSNEEVDRYTQVAQQLQQALGARETRVVPLRAARAADVAASLSQVAASSVVLQQGGSRPGVESLDAVNSVLLAGSPQQIAALEGVARGLDAPAGDRRAPLRVLRVGAADAQALAAALQRTFEQRTPAERAESPVRVEADPVANTLLVSASAEVLAEVESLVTQANDAADQRAQTEDGARQIRIFPLRVARAPELAATLDQMFPEAPVPLDPRTRQPRADLRTPRDVVVRADAATNSLIIDAVSSRLAGIEEIITRLDAPALTRDTALRTYRVARADLGAVAEAVRRAAESGVLGADADGGAAAPPGSVVVSVEPVSRTLLVSAPPRAMERIAGLIGELDAAATPLATSTRMFTLSHARAARIQPMLQGLLTRAAQEAAENAGTPLGSGARGVEVVADAATNALLVVAPEAVLTQAEELVKRFDEQGVAGAQDVRVVRLSRGSAQAVVDALGPAMATVSDPGAGGLTLGADATSNTVVLAGPRGAVERAEALVGEMDVAMDASGVGVRTIALTHARAESIAPTIQAALEQPSVLDAIPEWQRFDAIRRGGVAVPTPVRAVADARANTIVVSGPRALLELAEEMARGLDTARDAESVVRVLPLGNADASELAATVEALFAEPVAGAGAGGGGGAGGAGPAPVVRVDRSANALIVRASPADMARVEALVREVDDAAVSGTRQLRVIGVDRSRADARAMAELVRRAMEQQGRTRVRVIDAERLLAPDAESADEPKGAPAAPSTPAPAPSPEPAPARGSGVMPGGGRGLPVLHGGPAVAAIAVVVAQATTEPVASGAAADDDDAEVTIAVDPSTNSLLVVGSERAAQRIADLTRLLEGQLPQEPTQINVIRLPEGADAGSIAGTVRAAAQALGRASATNPGGLTGAVSVIADLEGDSVVVLARDTDLEVLRPLIAAVARREEAGPRTVKVYPLTSTTADRAARALRDLFEASPQGRQAQRVRAMEVSIAGPDGPVSGRLDPNAVTVTRSASNAALIVVAPSEALAVIDRLIEAVDQSPVVDRLEITRYPMRHARASELSSTLQELFDAQRDGPGAEDTPRARFLADERTNALLVTASRPQHAEIVRVLAAADASAESPDLELAMIPLRNVAPATMERIVREVVIGRDPARAERVLLSTAEDSRLLVVRADKDVVAQVRDLVTQADQGEGVADAGDMPVRAVTLERADARQVAEALRQFFEQRAALRARPGVPQRGAGVAVVGDLRSGTILVAASDEDFATVEGLVSSFDAPKAMRDLQLKVIPLTHAEATQTADTLRDLADSMRWSTWDQSSGDSDFFIEANTRTNSLVVMGRGEAFATVERVISSLDQPAPEGPADQTATAIEVRNADVQAVRTAIQRVMATPGWRSWRGPDPASVTIEVDRVRRALIVVGRRERVEQALAYVKSLDASADGAKPQSIEAITLSHARADRAGSSLRQFFQERARAQGLDTPEATILGSTDGNVLIAAGDEAAIALVRELVSQIDQPDQGKDRRVEVFGLKNATAADAAPVLRSVFATRPGADNAVVITPQPGTNALIVAAPEALFPQVAELVAQLDAPPVADDVNIETITLKTARAQDVATALAGALPKNVKVAVTPVPRSNSIILTGSREAVAFAVEQIAKLDEEPVRSGLAFRRIRLQAADAADVRFTVEQLLQARPRQSADPQARIDATRGDNTISIYAPADQIAEIEKIIAELDQPSSEDRVTEFVKLEHARAEQAASALRVFYGRFAPEADTPGARRVTVLPDAVSNSLVIRADRSQWEGIRALLSKLDTKEYDTSRQLAVIPLEHADAASVARALNEGFRAPIEEQIRRSQAEAARGGGREQGRDIPVLVDASSVPSVSAEPRTNALVVFAKPEDATRIEAIVRQLDVAGFEAMAQARIIPLTAGRPSALAATIREVYLNQVDRARGPRATLVIGDDASGALIVRADDERFAEVAALAQALQQQGQSGRVQPHVVRVRNVSAARLRPTLLAAFSATAQSQGESLAIEVDRGSNTLVIACSPRLLTEIKAVVDELDRPPPGGPDGAAAVDPVLGDTVVIADIVNNDPAQVRAMLEQLGVTRPAPVDRTGLVSEPVVLSQLASRRALAIAGSASDTRVVAALVRTLDAQPTFAEQSVNVVALRVARASTVARTLGAMLTPGGGAGGAGAGGGAGASGSGPARALAEHVRRLSVMTPALGGGPGDGGAGVGGLGGGGGGGIALDLSVPVRLIPDDEANLLLIASTPSNVAGLSAVVASLDQLPMGEAVVIRIFPLENASSTRVKGVLDGLFAQGDALRRLPGTTRDALPTTATGRALASEVAITIDERTNSLLVAGREEAVALVEVLVRDLDGERANAWIEPMVVPLRHADAVAVSARLNEVLIRGLATAPDALGLQRQYGRLRVARQRGADVPPAPGDPAGAPGDGGPGEVGQADGGPAAEIDFVSADLFAPVTGLIITAQEETNALLVIGTPANNQVVRALAAQLDTPAAANAEVRVYPLRFAAAERVAGLTREFFRQRVQAGGGGPQQLRREDDVVITTDARTNTLIVSTSPRSFAIFEGLLKTLDAEQASYTVGMHVIPIKEGDVRQLAPRIERLMRERLAASAQAGSVRDPRDVFTIEPEPLNNALIVAASDENLAIVKELIAALTASSAELAATERVEILQLARARAEEVAASIQTLYVEREVARRGPGSVRVSPNDRLNALIVSGNEQDMVEIRALAARLDRADIAATQQIKWIPLKSANATEVVALLQSVLAGRPIGGGRTVGARQATRIEFLRDQLAKPIAEAQGRPPTETEIDGAIRDQVTLTPDARTNAIWITAPEPMMLLLTEMIADMEATSAGARRIEHFRLKNADARQMATLLRDTFNLREQGRSLVLVPSAQALAPAPDAPDVASVTPVPDERMQLAIAIDARTNTLVVSGTEEYLTLVRNLVEQLDSIEATERDRRVYHLRNAKAKDIETTLQAYFRGENDTERRTLGADLSGSLLRRLEEEVTVIGDASSNKLVVSTSPRYMDAVMSIVKELDSAPPQVMIQVLLAEVTIDQSDQWGMDFTAGPFGGDAYRVGVSATNAGIATSLGVPNLSVSSADFGLLVRALESQGKLEVLSNPQVLANNNEPARIQVGEDVPLIDGVERSSQGQTFANVRREKVGIILDVTPSISTDGFVRMEIAPVISQLTQRTVELAEGVAAPIIAERSVETVVTVKDGQSVVIGGLIQTTEEQRRSKIPIIGDIPVLGVPFRSTQSSNVKTELLVILTPRVIGGQGEEDVATSREVSEQSLDRLDDPTAIEDYLDQIKADIRRTRGRGDRVPLVPAEAEPARGPSAFDPAAPASSPSDALEPYDPLIPGAGEGGATPSIPEPMSPLPPAPSAPATPSAPASGAAGAAGVGSAGSGGRMPRVASPVAPVVAPVGAGQADPDALGPLIPVPPVQAPASGGGT